MRMPNFENDPSRTELDMSRFNQLFVNANKQEAKADSGKARLTLVPRKILFDIARVREYGNKKYGSSENWKQVEIERYRDAAFRHFLALRIWMSLRAWTKRADCLTWRTLRAI